MKRRLIFFMAAILTAVAGCADRPSSGDRVLVAKFLYDTRIKDPARFDVVVFKFPDEGFRKGPVKDGVPTNYIKRLLGLPGEILAIFFGRLFHIPAPPEGEAPYYGDIANHEINPTDLWKISVGMHDSDDHAKKKFDAGEFKIVRKPPDVMLAMRRIVYDNDFPAKDLTGPGWERWKAVQGNGWSSDKAHGFTHGGAAKNEVDWLRYRHILRPMDAKAPPAAGRKPELITDFMGYNSFYLGDFDRTPTPNWVGDLMLECNVDVAKPEGELWLELSKGINRFQARWDLASGICTLIKKGPDGKEEVLDSKPTRLKAPGNYLVRFANIDARLTVWIDRDLPFDNGREYPPPEIRGPGETKLDEAALQARRGPTENDLEPASIGAKGSDFRVSGIKLWRDTYYTQNANRASDVSLHDAADWADPRKWGVFKEMPTKTMYVQPGHYLCLGDNSQQSSDSRDWGLVPERLMLGRALMVYFPLHRVGPIK